MSGYGCQSDHNYSRPPHWSSGRLGDVIGGDAHGSVPRHRSATLPTIVTYMIGPYLGIASAALDHVVAHADSRPVSFTSYQRQSDSTRPDYLTRARLRMHAAYAIQQCSKALDTLLAVHGEAAVSEFSILNIYMRDMHTATKHAMISPETNAELFGKALLGVQPNITPLI